MNFIIKFILFSLMMFGLFIAVNYSEKIRKQKMKEIIDVETGYTIESKSTIIGNITRDEYKRHKNGTSYDLDKVKIKRTDRLNSIHYLIQASYVYDELVVKKNCYDLDDAISVLFEDGNSNYELIARMYRSGAIYTWKKKFSE